MLKAVLKYSDQELVSTIESEKDINPAIMFLYQQHAEAVSSFIISRGGSKQDGEDIFQEAVVALIKLVKEGKYRQQASIRTFLIAISKNIWFNEIRKRKSTENREKIYEDDRDIIESDISEQIGDLEVKKQFRELLNRLGDPCKKLLLLFYYEDMSMKEIVSHLPYENEQVVRNKKYKCLKQLTTMVQANPIIQKEIK
jgi:RNA polymerase sigma factor (sigma-70 family)